MERRFDAVVVGEYERAFASGDQLTGVAAVLAGLGVEVWRRRPVAASTWIAPLTRHW
jgi:hypothetical protein